MSDIIIKTLWMVLEVSAIVTLGILLIYYLKRITIALEKGEG